MADDQTFRVILIVASLAFLPVIVYHRLKSQATGERLDRWQEGPFILFTLRPIGVACMLGLVAYMVSPRWMAWSSMDLPAWLRWTGVGIGCACALAIRIRRTWSAPAALCRRCARRRPASRAKAQGPGLLLALSILPIRAVSADVPTSALRASGGRSPRRRCCGHHRRIRRRSAPAASPR